MTATRILVQCDGANVPSELQQQSWSEQRPLDSRGSSQSLNLRADNLDRTVLTEIHSHAADLVRIASYVYAADQMASRGGTADAHNRKWRRHLAMCIPVLDPSFWAKESLKSSLSQVLAFLTEDFWEFHFSEAPSAPRQIPLNVRDQELLGTPDTVVLLSGGADSLCTAVEAAAVQNKRPVLVSHRSAPHLDARQSQLALSLREHLSDWSFPHLSFWIHRRGSDAAEISQRSRAFLFASLGAAVAAELGISEVLLGDNGVVSLNLPINAQLVGALATRSTHPKFIHYLNEFFAEVFPNRLQAANPLAMRTRAEVLNVLKEAKCVELLQETNSCSHTRGRPAATPQCGYCSQCVDRRFGTLSADLEEHDLSERYELDIFVNSLQEGEPRTISESFVRFAQLVNDSDEEELFNLFPQLFDCILPHDDDIARATGLTSMLKRHASNVLDVITMMITRYGRQLAEGTLPDDCLLRLVAGSDASRQARPVADQNVFRADGQKWTVTYFGMTRHFNHSKGMSYIARLIAHPGKEFHALDLSQIRPPHDGPVELTRLVSIDRYRLEQDEFGFDGAGRGDQLLDPQARREYQERIAHLKERRAQLRAGRDDDQIAEIDSEVTFIEHALNAATGLGGRPRHFADITERTRKAVSRNIHRSLGRIAEVHPPLHEHFRSSIKTGIYCSYQYSPPINWKT